MNGGNKPLPSYLFSAVNGLLEPDQLHGEGVSMETEALWGARHLLSQAQQPGSWRKDGNLKMSDKTSALPEMNLFCNDTSIPCV